MADDNHASFAKVGATVLAGVLATVAILVYLGGAGGRDHVLMV